MPRGPYWTPRLPSIALRAWLFKAIQPQQSKWLVETPVPGFKGEDADFRACMLNRFGSIQPEPTDQNLGDPWITSLAADYLTYWKHSLTKPDEREQAERELRSRVSKLLGRSLSNARDFDAAEDEIKREALKHGFYALLGRTQPLRELMLWKKLTVEQRQVNSPEGPQSVRVSYLDDFLLRGWGYYATCKRRSAGGGPPMMACLQYFLRIRALMMRHLSPGATQPVLKHCSPIADFRLYRRRRKLQNDARLTKRRPALGERNQGIVSRKLIVQMVGIFRLLEVFIHCDPGWHELARIA